jgi:hypothetical protein
VINMVRPYNNKKKEMGPVYGTRAAKEATSKDKSTEAAAPCPINKKAPCPRINWAKGEALEQLMKDVIKDWDTGSGDAIDDNGEKLGVSQLWDIERFCDV